MSGVLVLVEHQDGKLKPSAFSAMTLGKRLQVERSGPLCFLLVGNSLSSVAAEAAQYGADEVVMVEDSRLSAYTAEEYAGVLAAVSQQKSISCLAGVASSTGKDLFPRVAGLLSAAFVSDVSEIHGHHQFRRMTHAGNVWQTVKLLTPTIVVTGRQTEFPAVQERSATPSTIVSITAPPMLPLVSEVVEVQSQTRERPDLTDAKIVVAGGRGLKEKKNFIYLEQLCDLLGAALGASRAACDAGLVPNDLQVGQTGKVVAPELYIAVGISGAIQHLAGMKGSKVIVAINKDPEAPIFQIADYGLVSTWEQALPDLLEQIKRLQSAKGSS